MSVLLETSLGDIVIDLHTELAPRSCTNFLKLCSKHYYKFNAFFSVERDFLAQTGDPTNTGKGGATIWSQLPSTSQDKVDDTFFQPDTAGDALKHTKKGTVSFACFRKQVKGPSGGEDDDAGEGGSQQVLVAGSQFFITLKDEIDYLDGKHAPFGIIVEGQEPGGTLDKINAAFTDDQKRPLKDIRIRHVVVLEDPFPDPDGFVPPSRSPSPTPSQIRAIRLADDEDLSSDTSDRDPASKEESRRNADTNAAALTLEMVGDLPFAEIRPPENILFVCKLNPVTRSDDLELIFSRFGKILSCEVIKDKKTGDSLQYAFIEFDQKDDAERAYFKMQNVLVDDRRIWVDFSQSVSRLHGDWVKKRNGGREAPKGLYQWGSAEGKGKDGDRGAGRVDSYRPRESRDRDRDATSSFRGKQDDRRQANRYNGRDSRDGRGSSRRDQDDRDDDGQRASKRSRHQEEEDSRSRRREGSSSSRRGGEHSSTHRGQGRNHSNGKDRADEDRTRRHHDEDRSSSRRHDEDRRSSRRHDEEDRRHRDSRSHRDDRRDRDRDREHDRRDRDGRHDRDRRGDRRRDDDYDRHRHRSETRR